jgi:predicted nucleotidyltransferase
MSILDSTTEQQIIERVLKARAERPQFLARMKVKQQQGIKIARQCAKVLKEQFGVDKVVLFGSMLDIESIFEDSDIDLAVWGLPSHLYWKAGCALDNIIWESGFDFPPVDLVDVNDAKTHVFEAIKKEGVEL